MGSLYSAYLRRHAWEMTLFGPHVAQTTVGTTHAGYEDTNFAVVIQSLMQTSTTSFDGLELFPNSGTFGGTINVYGLVDPT